MDGGQSTYQPGTPLSDLADRLGGAVPLRLAQGLLGVVGHLHEVITDLRPTPDELKSAIDFLTDVGHSANTRRQEWVLLADVIGVSTLVEDLNCSRPKGATPNSLPGPFYRPDAPDLQNGANLSRDGRGEPLVVTGRLATCSGDPIGGAEVEVWHANSEGLYENQEPDNQPEFNLRGRLRADAAGRFGFQTIMPKGYALPDDGPVGRLMNSLGLRLERPAHVHFRVSAPGFDVLTTHVFDRDDPAIGRDALFGVKPVFLADFGAVPQAGGGAIRKLDVEFVLVPASEIVSADIHQN
jgi:hydroxyquinol 1,2-dioxygenase